MNELTTQWTYDLDEMSEDKSRPRVGTPPQKAFEIIGIDGNMNGGLRPISGFKEVAQLDYYYDSGTSDHSDVNAAYQFNYTSEVVDFFPVNFRLNHKLKTDGTFETENKQGYAYGYVYRVKQDGKTTSVFIEYYDSITGDWVSFGGNGHLSDDVSGNEKGYAADPGDSRVLATATIVTDHNGNSTSAGEHPDEKSYVTLVDATGKSLKYVAVDGGGDGTGAVVTGTVLASDSDTGSNTAGADLVGGIAVNFNKGAETVHEYLVQLKAAIEGSTGHAGSIAVSLSHSSAHTGAETMTLTSSIYQGSAANGNKTNADSGSGNEVATSNFTGGVDNDTTLLTDRFSDTTAQMSVSTWGSYVYVFCQGEKPLRFHVNEWGKPETLGRSAAGPFPGGGKQPKLHEKFLDVDNNSDIALTDIGLRDSTGAGTAGQQTGSFAMLPAELGQALSTSTTVQVPCTARIVGVKSATSGVLDGVDYGGNSNDPGAGYQNIADVENTAAPASTVNEDAHLFEPGDYAFAYYLASSKTGSKTQLSPVCEAKTEDFEADTSKYICLDIRYDSDQYDQAFVYRSVKTQDAGGAYIAGILHLDNIINLRDWHVNNGASGDSKDSPGIRTSVYWYQLNDTSLVYQDVYLDKTIHDEFMPSGGSSIFYEGSMVVSKIKDLTPSQIGVGSSEGFQNRVGDLDRGLGETKWSSIYEISPELFPPLNRYVPPVPTNEISRFIQVGPALMGFSRDRLYYLIKDGAFFRMQEAHRGYGIVNAYAGDSIGPLAYYVTSRGVKAVHANSRIDDVSALDKFIVEDWRDDHAKIQVAYDPTQLALYIHNPVKEQTAVMWFNTGKVTEIHDTCFDLCRRGAWSSDLTNITSDLEERALWVMNNPDLTHTSAISSTFRPKVYILDNERKSITSAGKGMIRMLQHSATTPYGTVGSVNTGENSFTISGSGVVTSDIVGAYCYVNQASVSVQGFNPASVGAKLKITGVNTSGNKIYVAAKDISKVGSGYNLSVSPVFMRFVGAPITSSVPTAERPYGGNNLFRVKQISSLGAVFSGVGYNHLSTNLLYWRGVVYEGEEEDPKSYAVSLDRTGALVRSINDGESDNWAAFENTTTTTVRGRHGVTGFSLSPGLEIFCVDVDYRLLQLQAKGTITATSNTNLTT